jgi:AAA+ superfamily predicted ATPase
MSQATVFDSQTPLPDRELAARARGLLGFDARYERIRNQLRLLLRADELGAWSERHHRARLPLCEHVAGQYPLVVFHGDVGTGKTATAECVANRLVAEAGVEDSILFKLSNRVRGSGRVGEMGTLITDAFQKVTSSAGKGRRAILVIDEGDSLATDRSLERSHHEDKVAVNTLIQCIDDLRRHGGRVVTFLCTNRLSVLDAALLRRAAVVEEFKRPDDGERRQLFEMDLDGLGLSRAEIGELVAATGARSDRPPWTYSDIRTRLYPAALAKVFPDGPLRHQHLRDAAAALHPSPVMEDR